MAPAVNSKAYKSVELRFDVGHWKGWAGVTERYPRVYVWEQCQLCGYETPLEAVGGESPAVVGARRSVPICEHDEKYHPEKRGAMILAAMKYLAGKARGNGQE